MELTRAAHEAISLWNDLGCQRIVDWVELLDLGESEMYTHTLARAEAAVDPLTVLQADADYVPTFLRITHRLNGYRHVCELNGVCPRCGNIRGIAERDESEPGAIIEEVRAIGGPESTEQAWRIHCNACEYTVEQNSSA